MGIPNPLKMKIANTIIKNVIESSDEDCRVQFGGAAIGIDVLRWQLWASYRLSYANTIKSPNCPFHIRCKKTSQVRRKKLCWDSVWIRQALTTLLQQSRSNYL